MPMIGGGIENAIHIRAVQDLSVIYGGKECFSPQLFGTDEAAAIYAAGGYHCHALHNKCSIAVTHAHSSSPYQCNADIVVGGNLLPFDQRKVSGCLPGLG